MHDPGAIVVSKALSAVEVVHRAVHELHFLGLGPRLGTMLPAADRVVL